MSLNKSTRKRSLPEWMKNPSLSPNRGKLSPNRKAQGPSYPPITVKKVKKLPKLVEGSVTVTDERDDQQNGEAGVSSEDDKIKDCVIEKPMKPGPSSKPISPSLNESDSELDDVFLTVDDLTRIAQEVINEELEKEGLRSSKLLSCLNRLT